MQYPRSAPNYAAEYQVSGLPFVTSSIAGSSNTTLIELPYVSRFVNVKNTGTNYLVVGFTNNGVKNGGQHFTIPPSGSFRDELRVKDLFFMAANATTTFEVVAGLTMVERRYFPTLTGSAAAGVAAANANLDGFGFATGMG